MGITRLPSGQWRLQIRRKDLRVNATFPTEVKAQAAHRQYTSGHRRGRASLTLDNVWSLYEPSLPSTPMHSA